MEFRDYYETLGVARDAGAEEIKRAYRRLARKYHPDVSKAADAQTRMQAVNEAYEVLRDPERRAAYDRLGKHYAQGHDFQPPPDWDHQFEFSGPFQGSGPEGFSEFFSQFFGSMGANGRAHRAAHGRDHHARIEVGIEEAYKGGTVAVTLQVPVLDENGRLGLRHRTLNVKLEPGLREGQHIRLAGQGDSGPDAGPAGDLYLEVHFRPHRLYRVENGADLHLVLPVAPWEAALGATVRVPTPGGTIEAKVPPGSQTGRKLRLRGRGLPGKPPGDLYLELEVVLPAARDERARKLYQEMARELAFDPRATLGV